MKTTILNALLNINDGVINGDINALEAYVDLVTIEKLFKNIKEGVKNAALDEAAKYGPGEHEAFGAKFQLKNGVKRWDFSNVSEHKELKGSLKALEESLKAIVNSKKFSFANAETGEMLELPTFTNSADTLAIKI